MGIRSSSNVLDEKHNCRGNIILAMEMDDEKHKKEFTNSYSFNVLRYSSSVLINLSAICSASDSKDPHAAFHPV